MCKQFSNWSINERHPICLVANLCSANFQSNFNQHIPLKIKEVHTPSMSSSTGLLLKDILAKFLLQEFKS